MRNSTAASNKSFVQPCSSARPRFEALEGRVLLSAAALLAPPATAQSAAAAIARPMASTPTLTLADRQELLKNWWGSNAAKLAGLLNAGDTAGFDNELLSYMRTRSNRHYFFDVGDEAGILSFINNDAGLRNQRAAKISKADDILAHRFPELVSSSSYGVQLPAGTIDWINQPSATSNTEFRYTLNRHFFWNDLAMAYRFTNDSRYLTELVTQLDSWSRQYTRLSNPDSWIADTVRPKWDLFTTSERVKNWFYAYNMVLGSGGFSAYYNTMFLHRLLVQGDFMARTTKLYELTSNKATGHWTALYELALLFPEFKQSSTWLTKAQTNMYLALDAQFRADGVHYEQSPGYHGGAMSGFFDAYRLSALNGAAWGDKPTRKLRNVIEAYYQLLSPDGTQAALSDTYRSQGTTFFTRAAILFGDTRWPKSRPRLDDVWQLGTAASTPLLTAPTTPTSLPGRGGTAYFSTSGYYITRSGDDGDARQLTFDAGTKGGDHGHYDLLNFELYGYGKPLISDPGLLSYSSTYQAQRAAIVSTPAHNTISIDGLNHAASENPSIAKLTLWSRKTGGVQMAATSYAYEGLKGAPVVARNIWHDRVNVFVVVDFGYSRFAHTYSQTFNLFTNNNTGYSGGAIRTTTGSGDVMLQPVLLPGQTVSAKSTTLSNSAPPSGSATGTRFTISQSTTYAVFATLVATFDNGQVPNVSARWLRLPNASRSGMLEVNYAGTPVVVYFGLPDMSAVPTALSGATAGAAAPAHVSKLVPQLQVAPVWAALELKKDQSDWLGA